MKLRIVTGNSNPELAHEISLILGTELTNRICKKFSDGESYVQISENIRGDDVFIIQSVCSPVNDNLMDLLIMIDALKRASAGRITAVMLYYGYARQDRKSDSREPITAKLVADMITKAGASRILAIDLHVPQIQGFFDVPVDEISAIPSFAEYLRKKNIIDPVVVAPDVGATKRARSMSKRLNDCPIAIIDKKRSAHNQAEIMNIVGDVKGKSAVLVDDIIDTGTSIVNAVELLSHEAKEVYVCATHAVFSSGCIDKLNNSAAKEIIVSNTIPVHIFDNSISKIKIISMAKILSDVISCVHNNKSVGELFH